MQSSTFPAARLSGRSRLSTERPASGSRPTLRDHTGAIHLHQHSGAIYRLSLSGNPRSTQEQLRHKSAGMTLRYLKTLSHLESMNIEKSLDIWR